MKGHRKVRCACCGVVGIHEARGLIKSCYERIKRNGYLANFARRPLKVVVKRERDKPMQKHIYAIWNALLVNPHASLQEIADQVGCVKSTAYQATRKLQRLGLIAKEFKRARARRITGVSHAGHAYRIDWYD